jgi:hypothetical protein
MTNSSTHKDNLADDLSGCLILYPGLMNKQMYTLYLYDTFFILSINDSSSSSSTEKKNPIVY